jgi:hypothetical protein
MLIFALAARLVSFFVPDRASEPGLAPAGDSLSLASLSGAHPDTTARQGITDKAESSLC